MGYLEKYSGFFPQLDFHPLGSDLPNNQIGAGTRPFQYKTYPVFAVREPSESVLCSAGGESFRRVLRFGVDLYLGCSMAALGRGPKRDLRIFPSPTAEK